MNRKFQAKLEDLAVDLYAGGELPEELEEELEAGAFNDPELCHDMVTLRQTVEALRRSEDVAYTEESHQRILMRIYAEGFDIRPKRPTPNYLQFHLPICG
ncbi:MAG: hypothetical protein N2109_03075 [Fimbriimonadales bacterium]|nr:hypothetical protein [Fimbriimonadales bacterium]